MAKNNSSHYVKIAQNSGKIKVVEGSKHIKLYGEDSSGNKSMMTVPRNLKGDGTECAIIKWLKRMGVILGIIGFLLLIIANHTNFL